MVLDALGRIEEPAPAEEWGDYYAVPRQLISVLADIDLYPGTGADRDRSSGETAAR